MLDVRDSRWSLSELQHDTKDVLCAFVVYDVTNRESFVHVHDWVEALTEGSCVVSLTIIGAKSDLHAHRVVSPLEGRELAQRCNAAFVEAASSTCYDLPTPLPLTLPLRPTLTHALCPSL